MCTEPLAASQIRTQVVAFPAGDKLILAALCLCLFAWKNLTAGIEPLQTCKDVFNAFPTAIHRSSGSNSLPAQRFEAVSLYSHDLCSRFVTSLFVRLSRICVRAELAVCCSGVCWRLEVHTGRRGCFFCRSKAANLRLL